jgi:hypothetical protein
VGLAGAGAAGPGLTGESDDGGGIARLPLSSPPSATRIRPPSPGRVSTPVPNRLNLASSQLALDTHGIAAASSAAVGTKSPGARNPLLIMARMISAAMSFWYRAPLNGGSSRRCALCRAGTSAAAAAGLPAARPPDTAPLPGVLLARLLARWDSLTVTA